MNMQNIPRADKTVKAAVQPKLDLLMFFDYSQIEYRLWSWYMAMQCDDWQGVETFREGRDIHEETARGMFEIMGWEYDPENDEHRQYGKTNNFSAIYAGGVQTVQHQLACDKSTAAQLVDAFHGRYPLLGRWEWDRGRRRDPDGDTLNGQIVARLRERGYITTLWGRHLHPTEDRKALNALVQGGAADLMKASMVRVAHWLRDEDYTSHMVLSVHDEIGLDVREDEKDALMLAIPRLMADEPDLTEVLPIEVDCKISYTNWAEAKEEVYERG